MSRVKHVSSTDIVLDDRLVRAKVAYPPKSGDPVHFFDVPQWPRRTNRHPCASCGLPPTE